MQYDDRSPMPFGMHKGKPLGRVPADYLMWLYNQPSAMRKYPSLKDYIENNLSVLKTEMYKK